MILEIIATFSGEGEDDDLLAVNAYEAVCEDLADTGLLCGGQVGRQSSFIMYAHSECDDKECPVPLLPDINKAVMKEAVCIIEDHGFVVEKTALSGEEEED